VAASGDWNAECASHQGPGKGNLIFFPTPLPRSAHRGERQLSGQGGELGGGGCTWRSEVDSEEMWTWR